MAKLSDIKLNEYDGQVYNDSREKNIGNPLTYLGGKLGTGFVRSVEGIADLVWGGGQYLGGLIANSDDLKEKAKNTFADDWFDYDALDKWYNPSNAMRMAGDVASGIGNSALSLGTAFAGGAALNLTSNAIRAISLTTLGLSATGNATGEAVKKTGELGGREFLYGALSGAVEVGTEAFGDWLGTGSGRVLKGISNQFASDSVKAVAHSSAGSIAKGLLGDFFGEAIEEGLSAIADPWISRATGVDPNAEWNWGEIGYEALIGGLSGLVMGSSQRNIQGVSNLYAGSKAVSDGRVSAVLSASQSILKNGSKYGIDEDIMKNLQSAYDALQISMKKTNGEVSTIRQKELLGVLSKNNMAALVQPFIQREAVNIVLNAEETAKQYSAFMTDENGNKLNLTADAITNGVTIDTSNPETMAASIRSALKNNQVLAGLAIMSFAGKVNMQRDAWVKYNAENPGLVNQSNLGQFVQTASEAEKAELGRILEISDWNKVSPEEVNEAFRKKSDVILKAVNSAASAKEMAKGEKNTAPKRFTKTTADGAYDIGDGYTVVKQGDSYRVYNAQNDSITREIGVSEVNALLNEKTREEASRKAVEEQWKAKEESEKVEEVAKRAVENYDKLSETVKNAVRMTIRQASANGVSTEEMAMCAKISANTGLNVVFSLKTLDAARNAEGKIVYADAQYDLKNTVYVNPTESRTKKIGTLQSHELAHWIWQHLDAKSKAIVYSAAVAGLGTAKAKEVMDRYEEVYSKTMSGAKLMDALFDEVQARYAEEVMTSDEIWNALLSDDASLQKKVPAFVRDWAKKTGVPYAVKVAEAYAKAYTNAFRRLSAYNRGANAYADMAKLHQDVVMGRANFAFAPKHKEQIKKRFTKDAKISQEELMKRYDAILDIWKELDGEINSEFLKKWNSKKGKDSTFAVFKSQSGYKYNAELSTMCKKGLPLFEAIDTIVRKEMFNKLNTETLGKAEKQVLYDVLKSHGFEIPCAICYVEQARQREGKIIHDFLNGNASGKVGWNTTLTEIEGLMEKAGVPYHFPSFSRSITSESYVPVTMKMTEEQSDAFYKALMKIANREIDNYNASKEGDKKFVKKAHVTQATPEGFAKVFKGNMATNLVLIKTLAFNPDSRAMIADDLLYSSVVTENLSRNHQDLYSLFNRQGGTAGYKTKQRPSLYLGEVLGKNMSSSAVRNQGGIRNQSNSDLQMYLLLDMVQMFVDASAKGYYIHLYTKVPAELKLLGLSGAKMNASAIPKIYEFKKEDGTFDRARTEENAGLDENGNLLFDYVEGINLDEVMPLVNDPEYSKNVGIISIGYSDNHIRKLLADPRIQLIIGFHDKTNNPAKRYRGAKWAHNYNGENEAIDQNGKTQHVTFGKYLDQAEKMFGYSPNTEKHTKETVSFNGKEYTFSKAYDGVPKLAADLYLADIASKNWVPAYAKFANDPSGNYYKLLGDFTLYNSEGQYAPHRKVQYFMPDTVPVITDRKGKITYGTQNTKSYIKEKLMEELSTVDKLSFELENGMLDEMVDGINNLSAEEKATSVEEDIAEDENVASKATESRNSLPEEEINSIIEQAKSNVEGIFNEIAIRQGISTTTGENASRSRRGYDANSYASENGYADVHTIAGLRQLCESGEQGVSVALRDDICREMVSGIFTKIGRLTLDERMIYRSVVRAAEGTSDFTYNSIWHEVVFPRCYTAEMLTTREINNKLGISTGYYFGYPVRRGWRDEILYNLGYARPGGKEIFIRADQETADGVVQTIPDVGTVEAGAPSLTGRHERMHILAKLNENSSSDLIGSINKMKLASHGLGTSIKGFSKTMDTLLGYTVLRWGDRGDAYNYNEEIMAELYAGTIKLSDKKAQAYIDKLVANIDKAIDNEPINGMRFSLPDNIIEGTEEADEYGRYSLADNNEAKPDAETLKRLNSEPTVTVYRAMQVIDGKLYPPMAAKIKGENGNQLVQPSELGEWEQAVEHPELITNNPAGKPGYFKLDKGNGSSILARYNPYFHTSRIMLNDQFSSASKRPNLVVVEGEVPASELTSGYKAQYAKDAVGEMTWHSGPVAGKLPKSKARKVILSRWFKPTRILTDSEVADSIAKLMEGENIAIPDNVVTPGLRSELIKRGVMKDTGRYSMPSDADYMKAVEDGDMKTVQKMVRESANEAGFNSPMLYHGTDSFGFTRPDVNAPGGDGFSFWATDSKHTAASYTEYGEVRGISEELTEESLEKLTAKAEEDIDDEISHFCGLINKHFSEWFFGYDGGEDYVKEKVFGANPEAGNGDGVYDELIDLVIDAYDKYGDRYNYEEFYEFQEESKEFEEIERSIVVLEGLYRRYNALVNKNYDELVGGIYQLYGNTDGFYVVEGNGADWNNLPHEGLPKISRYGVEDAAYSTRDYSLWARDNGYKGILFKNIHDNGRYGLSGTGNVYAFFEPLSQVRSADPVTYDDQGNVIPLSERFNTKKDDFRWSLPEDDLKEAKRIKKLAEQQSERATERLQKSRKLVQDNTAANKATNRVLDLAQKLKEYVTKRKYVSSSVLANPLLDAWAKELGKLKYRSDIRKASARKILVGFSQFYNKNNDVLTDYYKSMNQEMDANVLGALELIKNNIADKNVNFKPLSLEELQAAEVILGAADALFRNFDTVVIDGKRELTQTLAEQEIEILQSGDPKEYKKFVKAMLLAQKYLNNATDPRAVIKWLEHYDENGILTKLFKSITDGETASMKQNVVFMTPFEDFLKKHKKYSKRLAETKIALDAISGQVNLTVGQAIALYELTKREQAQRGLVESGVSFADDNGLTKSARFFGEGKYSEEEIKKYAEQIRYKVAQHLTAEDMEFIGLVEDFFNNQSKAVKTEADMELYGYTNALEEFYYPIKRAASTIATSFSNVQSLMADIAAMNTFSFNKDTVKNARNQLYLNSVYDTVQQHARLMSVYANMYKALEAFSRVMNRNIGTSTEVTSVRKYLQEHVWADSETYLKKLMADIQGVKNEQLGDKLWGGLRGAFAKAQLGANLKVIFAQTASLPTAMTRLSPSSIAYGITHKVNFKDLDRYSDWAMVRNHEQAIVKAEGVVDKVGKVGDMLSKPIQWTDRLTIGLLWNACQAEVKKTKGLEIGTEENKIEAAKLLESVGRDTQPNYTNTERSGMMRGNQFLKTLTMFTSAPLKQVSRFLEAAGEYSYALKTKNKTKIRAAGRRLRKTLAAILLANMMYCLIGQFFTWLYKKDRKNKAGEEISFAQDYFTDVAGTTIGMFPVAKSVFDYFNKGYDLSSFDFDIINDILNTTGDIVGLVEKAASGEHVERSDFGSALRSTVYSASQLAGIPTKNVMNTVTGLFKRFDPEVAYGLDSFFYGQDYRKDLNAYVAEGNEKMSNLLMDLYTKENTGTMSKDAQKTLLNLYTQGYDVLPKSIGNKISYSYKDENGDTQTESFTLNAQQKKQFKAIYSEATPVIEAMLDSKAFQKLSEENQAKAIRSVNNAYYIKAKNAVTETATANSLLMYFPKDTGKYATILAGLSDVTADTDKKGNVINGTKKQNVYKYLTSNGLTKNEALYVMAVKGYSLKNLPVSEANARKMLLKYILSLPVSQSEKAAIAEHCGFTVKGNRIISKNG